MYRGLVVPVVGFSLAMLASCRPQGDGSPAPTPSAALTTLSPNPQTSSASMAPSEYEIRGTITAVSAEKRTVTLDHEAIPGLMPAMTMEYKVDDPVLLGGLKAADRITGRLRVQRTDYVIVELQPR